MSDSLKDLSDAGVSIWLDDLSRERLTTGTLAEMIADRHVVGVTTNPTIFAGALSDKDDYADQVAQLAAAGADVNAAIRAITTDDVRTACELFAPVYEQTDGVDGRVSIEVEPGLAMDTDGTVAQAKQLHATVARPNVYVKIPATAPGVPAITQALGAGIDINVTLIFSLQRYREVIEAYVAGLELAARNGHDLSRLHSVASFFVSRVDVEVDKRLEAIGTEQALALRGKAGVANARLAYQVFTEVEQPGSPLAERWAALVAQGARPQRPLWASTGVKNPDYPDTMYVADLVVGQTVNTMPEKTMDAFADHGVVAGDQVTPNFASAQETMAALAAVGIDIDDVTDLLEREGVEKFDKSWAQLVTSVQTALDAAGSATAARHEAGV